ncbi:hypothetical protein ZYGR_0N04000 [Zygosaccharomyces rouxii]|uniref:ZYRO0D09482p n=2 Tax=Zygosaccharomyces rouxii TaxID=4956 RepID=C5DVU4_ZYGRC|nr:uncharacterized protein ZYRO0D09482g [Zygosaccharomyces rouxii]KAH9200823.1 hypothetical protein LQ764DRAFT_229826 [Zygosaccharomyces rouxii]GAV48995.1 hypothetical protein ZYGR_0N04000 [Zygosaccharomyces rouxii]CAR27913.1 ZYRO0D09482p [Zygosaccharomyces rouxii]
MSVEEASQRQEQLSGSKQEVPMESKDEGCVVDGKEQSQEKEGQNVLDDQLKGLSIEDNIELKGPPKLSREEKYTLQVEADARSIFVGNISPDVTPEIIEEHFAECGEIKRITLLHDKHTGVPKGYAYVQFESSEVQENALKLNGTELKGNKINVYKKRTNLPGYHRYSQDQRPVYYPNQWGYTYTGFPDFKGMNFFPPYPFQPDQRKHFGGFNYSYRGKQRNNYRGGRRGNGARHFHKYEGRPRQNDQRQDVDQQQILENGEQFSSNENPSDEQPRKELKDSDGAQTLN